MKHFRIDGLYMRDQVYMEGDRKSPRALMFLFCDYLMLLMASWTILTMLIGALSITLDMKLAIYCLLPYSFVTFILFVYSKYFGLKLIFMMAFYGYMGYRFFPRIENGFYIIENLVIDRINEYYHYQYDYFIADYENMVRDLTTLMIFLMVLIITILIIGMHRESMKHIGIFLLSLPLILHFSLGKVPSGGTLIGFLLVYIYLMKRPMDYRKAMSKVHLQIALCLCLLVLFLYGLASLFLSRERYEEMESIKELKAKVEAPFYAMSWDEFVDKVKDSFDFMSFHTAVGGLDGGKLGDVDEVVFTQSEQLTVLAPYSSIENGLYLKGYVGSVYTGTSWDAHEAEEKEAYQKLLKKENWDAYSPFNQISNLLLKNESGNGVIYEFSGWMDSAWTLAHRGQIRINYKGATERFLYVPYHMNVSQYINTEPVQDLYIKPKIKEKEYEWDYYFNPDYTFLSLVYNTLEPYYSPFYQQEKLYREFVYDAYTKVPDEGMERLKGDMAKALTENSFNNYMEYVDYVIHFIHSKTSYSLSPGKLPKDRDYVEYFIYENNIGYCAHYATAATLMLRMLGIPARYVEGYAVDRTMSSSDGTYGDMIFEDTSIYPLDQNVVERQVLDSNAHAWIEIYAGAVGWIPVEVTPGSNYVNNSEVLFSLEQETQLPGQQEEGIVTEAPTPTPTPEEVTIEPTVEALDPVTSTPDGEQVEDNQSSGNGLDGNSGNQEKGLLYWLKHPIIRIIGIIIGLMGLLLGSYRLYHWNIQRKLVSNGQKGLYLYNRIERVFRLCGGIPTGKKHLEEHIQYAYEHINYLERKDLYDMVELAQKARFQIEDLREEDLVQIRTTYQSIISKVLSNETLIKGLKIRLSLLF